MSILFGITLTCSDVCCQGTELEIRVSLTVIIEFIFSFFKLVAYHKKKIQLFLLNMSFISLVK